jgi:Ca-activated chloride channel family protein
MTQQSEQAELISLISNAPASIRVFCVGIGNEVNRPLLKQLSEKAGGLAAFVSLQDDFRRQSQAFRRKLMRPVATNVRIQLNGVETYDVLPGELPDLFYGSPLRMIGRYKRGGVSQVSVSGEVMGKPFEQTIDVSLPQNSEDNPEIERMWAYWRVQQMMEQLREHGNNPDKENEIVRLCEGYSIVSEYASFIVLENDAEYQRWSIQRRNATRVQRDDSARKRLQVELDRLREQSLAAIGPNKGGPESDKSSVSPLELPGQPAIQSPNQPSTPALDRSVVNNRPSDLNLPTTNAPAPVVSDPGTRGTKGGGGGGAIDPLSCAIALGMAGASAWAARRRRTSNNDGPAYKE